MKNSKEQPYTNQLIHETSPYLLQHAHNPVDWYPFGKEAFQKAQEENKLIIVSIGYSACHWCHVMEHESFEDKEVAKVMNENFISIKVDREERPDVDNVYMDAIHLMGQQGGWPLNCIALPDGRPIFGGTYFPKERWISMLEQLQEVYRNDKERMLGYAQKLTEGMKQQAILQLNQGDALVDSDIHTMVKSWSKNFDMEWGGSSGAPKFPMPNGLSFLLRYHYFSKNEGVKKYIETTLDKMAAGGIYDHVGGGFARYSTDERWKVPHFEKMLYDNAQLISVYSEGYKLFKKPRYKQVVYETIAFLEIELSDPNGGFYAALDADSEGEEGKFYVWTYQDVSDLLGEKMESFERYYGLLPDGNWEHGINILFNTKSIEKVAKKLDKSIHDIEIELNESKEILLKARNERIRPGLDNKILTSWNALAISGLTDAYKTFNDSRFLDLALKHAKFIEKELRNNNIVNRMKTRQSTFIQGFLDDYALLAKAYIDLYEVTFDENWLNNSTEIVERIQSDFYNNETDMFNYSNKTGEKLFSQKIETSDNVIPSSNSVLAGVLNRLGNYYSNTEWLDLSTNMLSKVGENMKSYGAYYSNWGVLAMQQVFSWKEVVIVGKDAKELYQEFNKEFQYYQLALSESESDLPIMQGRFNKDETFIYVCQNRTCKLPVKSAKEALLLMEEK